MKINKDCLKYLAGIIDGEGHLGVYKENGVCHITFRVRNTNKDLIDWLERNYGGHINGPYSDGGDNHAEQYTWALNEKYLLYKMCKFVLPFLIVKREICELCIEAYEDTFHWDYHGRGLPVHAREKREIYYHRTLELNQVGIKEINEKDVVLKLKKRKVVETLEEYM